MRPSAQILPRASDFSPTSLASALKREVALRDASPDPAGGEPAGIKGRLRFNDFRRIYGALLRKGPFYLKKKLFSRERVDFIDDLCIGGIFLLT